MTILAAAALGMTAMGTAMSLDAGNLYVAKLQNQRAADLANLAAAATPAPVAGAAASAVAVATARNVVELNGLAGATVATVAVPSTRTPGAFALSTTVSRPMPRLFPGLTGGTASAMGATSIADPGEGSDTGIGGSCLGSLVGPTNIYDNAVVTGPACSVGARTYLYVCGSAAVTLAEAKVGVSQSDQKPFLCRTASMQPGLASFGYKATITDAIASHPDILAIRKHFAAMASPGWPFGSTSLRRTMDPPTPSGTAMSFSNTADTLDQAKRYGELRLLNATLTFTGNGGAADPTCATPTTINGSITLTGTNTLRFRSGCYVIAGSVVSQNGARTTFSSDPGADVTFVFKQSINNDSGSMTFPDATYSLNGDVNNTRGGTMAFGAGAKVFGAAIRNETGVLRFGDGPHYVNGGSIANGTGTLSFGSGPFYLWGGSMSNGSTGAMSYGDGPFYFYGGSIYNVSGDLSFGKGPVHFGGGSMSLSARSNTTFGVGNVDFYGGSAIFGGANVTFGYGGSATTGSSTVSLYGGSMALTQQNLTAVGVTFAVYGGSISLLGSGTVNATAPTARNPSYGYSNILFVVFGGTFNLYQASGVADTMSGLIYVPVSNISIYNGQAVRYPPGGCLQIVAGVLDIYQRARLDVAPCAGLALASSGSGVPGLAR